MNEKLRQRFSFHGRVSRKFYWLAVLAVVAADIVSDLLIVVMQGRGRLLLWLLVALSLSGLGLFLFVGVKRLHDRDKSAWWIMPMMVAPCTLQILERWANARSPGNFGWLSLIGDFLFAITFGLASVGQILIYLIAAWTMVELGFLKGTIGPNRFGPDPLTDETAEAFT